MKAHWERSFLTACCLLTALFLAAIFLLPAGLTAAPFCLPGAKAEEAVTLRTVTCFSGTDPGAEAYGDLLREFESKTGISVSDRSSTSDEAWKTSVLNDFAAGNEPDLLFFFAAGADSAAILPRVVPVNEINAAYPELRLPETEALREPDGRVYAVPTRGFWEGLYVRSDLFERFGAPLPTSWENLEKAVAVFRENGIVPIAASLSDIPHYVAEMAILACADAEEQRMRPQTAEEVPDSWRQGMRVIRELCEMGAFAENVLATDDGAAVELFLKGEAAMRLDGSWMTDRLSPEDMERIIVLPMPKKAAAGSADGYIGGVSMGFYLTRKAWNSPARRDAAVSLLALLTAPESLRRLGNGQISGALERSVAEMTEGREMLSPLQDAMNREARETWLLKCVPAVAEGLMTPEECWAEVMALAPFSP